MKKGTKVNIIIAPHAVAVCATLPGQGLTLLDAPENPGFKAWIEHHTPYWEHGETREDAEKQMIKRLEAEDLLLGNITHRYVPVQ